MHRRRLIGLVLAAACAVACAASRADAPNADGPSTDPPWIRFDALTVLSESSTPPGDDAAWEPIRLPDSWRLTDRYKRGISAWYRFDAGAKPAVPYSLYLWRFSMNVEAFFNGESIGSGGTFDEPIARNWNRPFLFGIPMSAWRESDNRVYVHLRVYPGWGTFTPPALGPTAGLAPAYESRYFWQITMAQYSVVVTLTVMLLCIAFWLTDRRDTTYLFFAAASAAWSLYTLNLFVQHVPMSAKAWWWLVHTSVDCFSLFVLCFAHRLLHVHRPRIELAMLAAVLVASTLYAAWDLPTFAHHSNSVHAVLLLAPTYLVVWLVGVALRDRQIDAIVFSFCIALLFGLAVHDVFLNSLAVPELWATRFFLLQFGAPVVLLVMVVHLARRLALAIGETRAANVRLEARVGEVTQTLERTFADQRDLERRQAAAQERERIYQDLHDDVGARLLSLVYATEGKGAALAREALREMRSIVSSERIEGGPLVDAAADWRAESESRCEAAGLALDWEAAIPQSVRLTGLQRYHLERVVRELVSNALKHSSGKRVSIRIAVAGDRLGVAVADDGRGFARAATTGRGVTGIEQRIARLGGTLVWAAETNGGSRCEIGLPLPPNGG